jgi:hypothetical protein
VGAGEAPREPLLFGKSGVLVDVVVEVGDAGVGKNQPDGTITIPLKKG